ncbi:YggS family pyridoxal phosphate-dependent enzyme [Propionibacterium sp.]|uniref:YggS family pyridoxal phosphate-dependent enzyme n=1 Tax=Propionibacterium sp. TaxID=1977903 RepID=UPI0039ECE918
MSQQDGKTMTNMQQEQTEADAQDQPGRDAEQAERAVEHRVATVWEQIGQACTAAGRPRESVRLLPVSKRHSVEAMRRVNVVLDALAARNGLTISSQSARLYGENHVQEIVAKSGEIGADEGISMALIGHLQSNKVNAVAGLVEEFQALDSLKLAAKLDRKLSSLGRSLRVLVEVNTSGEANKHGVPFDQALDLCGRLGDFDCLDVQGLMTVAINSPDQAVVGACFDRLAELQKQLRDDAVLSSSWPELSMGMSGDFPLAIAHGATTVRIGTALFGPRDYDLNR